MNSAIAFCDPLLSVRCQTKGIPKVTLDVLKSKVGLKEITFLREQLSKSISNLQNDYKNILF